MNAPRPARRASPRYAFVEARWARVFGFVDAIGARVRPRPRPPGDLPRRILLVNLAHLGDVVLATAALRTIRAARPEAHIAMMVSPLSAAVLDGHPALDQRIVFDAGWWGRAGTRRLLDARGIARMASLIRAGRFDLVIQLKSFFQENLAAALAGCPRRIGYGVYGGGFLQTHEVEYPWEAHTVEQNAALLAACGMPDASPRLDIQPREVDIESGDSMLRDASGPFVALHPGAGTPSKRWPLERFLAVGESLCKLGYRIVLVGGRDDAGLAERFRAHAARAPIDTCGRLHPLATAAVLRRCTAFVGSDSAPAHLAAAMNIPTVVVFSGTNVAARWKPWGERVVVMQARPPCSPCGLDECPLPGHDCLTAITPEQVLRALARQDGGRITDALRD